MAEGVVTLINGIVPTSELLSQAHREVMKLENVQAQLLLKKELGREEYLRAITRRLALEDAARVIETIMKRHGLAACLLLLPLYQGLIALP